MLEMKSTRILPVAIALSTLVLLLMGCNSGGAAQLNSPAGPSTQVVSDSMGMCQMTIPDGWHPDKKGSIGAYGPEGSKAELLVGAGAGAWESEKTMVKNFYLAGAPVGQKITILRDDKDALIFDTQPGGSPGYTLVAARPRKSGYCWVTLTSNAAEAREKLAGVFKSIAASVKSLE